MKKYYRDRAAAVGMDIENVSSNISPSAIRLFTVLRPLGASGHQVFYFRGGKVIFRQVSDAKSFLKILGIKEDGS